MYPTRRTQGDATPKASQLPIDSTGHTYVPMKDSSYVRHWVDTSAKVPLGFQDLASPLSPAEQAIYGVDYSGLPLDYAMTTCNGNLYGTDMQAGVVPTNLYLQADSLSSSDGSHPGDFPQEFVGSADMVYTTSSHSMAFSNDYHSNSGIACSAGSVPQATFSVSTAWSSPSSASMEPAWVPSYTAPGFMSNLTGSPPLFAGSEDSLSASSGHEDILPASLVDCRVQSPIDFCQPEMMYSENARLMTESGPISTTSKPIQDYTRPPITEATFWPPVESMPMVIVPGLDNGYHNAGRAMNGPTNATAREHHLYHVEPDHITGLYHCPFGPSEGCRHKADKLKCNYDKHLDSHLKPYRCKYNACSSVPFSSTACLLRHEREAHGMHGHGSNPFKCHYPECDRGRGFPRRYNLEDHMKRMHGFEPSANGRRRSHGDGDATKAAASTVRVTKRKNTAPSAVETPSKATKSRPQAPAGRRKLAQAS